MDRLRITKDCEGLKDLDSSAAGVFHLTKDTLLYVVRDWNDQYYKAAYGGEPVFVPKSCAVLVETPPTETPARAKTLPDQPSTPLPDTAFPSPSTLQAPITSREATSKPSAIRSQQSRAANRPAPNKPSPSLPSANQEAAFALTLPGGREIEKAPLIVTGFALLTAFGSSQTWARAIFVAIDGTEADRGVVTLLAALAIAALCVWRVLWGMRDLWYFAATIPLALAAFLMPLWFLVDVLTEPPADFFDAEVRVVTASWGLYMTVGSAAVCLGSLVGLLASQALEAVARR